MVISWHRVDLEIGLNIITHTFLSWRRIVELPSRIVELPLFSYFLDSSEDLLALVRYQTPVENPTIKDLNSES